MPFKGKKKKEIFSSFVPLRQKCLDSPNAHICILVLGGYSDILSSIRHPAGCKAGTRKR